MEKIFYYDYQNACEVLGVHPKQPLEEISKVYKNLMKQYHTDVTGGKDLEAEARVREITEAFAIIKKYIDEHPKKTFDNNKMNYDSSDSQLDKLRNDKAAFLFSMVNFDDIQLDSEDYKWLYNLLARLLSKVVIIIHNIHEASTLDILNDLFFDGKQEVERTYREIEKKYCDMHHIPHSFSLEKKINYQVNVKEFVNQLEELKKEYFFKTKNNPLFKVIEQIIENYKLYAGYEYLKKYINEIKEKYMKKVSFSVDEQAVLFVEMKKEIEDLFQMYFEQQVKYKRLLKIPIDRLAISDGTKLMKLKDVLGTSEFEVIYQELNNKYGHIVNETIFNENEENIRLLYQDLRQRASKELEHLNFTNDFQRYYAILGIEKQVLDLIMQAKNGLISYDALLLLKNITFQNELEDMNVLQSVSNNSQRVGNTLYVFNGKNSLNPLPVLQWLTWESGNYYMNYFESGLLKRIQIREEELNKNYMPFHTFLEKAQFVGICKGLYVEEKLLYVYNKIALKRKSGRFFMDVSSLNEHCVGYKKVSKEEEIIFQDKEYITQKILEQINQDLEEINGMKR